MPTRNVNLTDHQDRFVGASLVSGQYQNASEVFRQTLRLLERREARDAVKLARLRAAIAEAELAIERGGYEDVELADLPAWLSALGNTATK